MTILPKGIKLKEISSHQRGGRAFFFFFSAFLSPDFESEEFRRYCEACYRVRAFKPTLTLSGLHSVLAVAANDAPISYGELAEVVGLSYSTTSIQAAILSDGRGSQPGLKLLKRLPGRNRREKCLVVSRTGRAVAKLFCGVESTAAVQQASGDVKIPEETYRRLQETVIPALKVALQVAPDINLTTYSVLLFIAQNSERFGHFGDPSSHIAKELGISNLPRNLAKLSDGSSGRHGLALVELRKSPADRRVTHPSLSKKGLAVVANTAARLLEKAPSPVRQPKGEKLLEAGSPEDVAGFDDEDFDIIEINKLE